MLPICAAVILLKPNIRLCPRAYSESPEIAKQVALYGVKHREDWSSGLTILSAISDLCDHLQSEERIAPLYHGLVHIARDCAGQTPKFNIQPLHNQDIPQEHLKRWFRYFVGVRSTEGAERCLLTAIHKRMTDGQLADIVVTAATDHFYLDDGHVVDFINKAFELLDRVGWEHASRVLPSLIRPLCTAARSEERNAWRAANLERNTAMQPRTHLVSVLVCLRGTRLARPPKLCGPIHILIAVRIHRTLAHLACSLLKLERIPCPLQEQAGDP